VSDDLSDRNVHWNILLRNDRFLLERDTMPGGHSSSTALQWPRVRMLLLAANLGIPLGEDSKN
jgi:hypothetical protein